MKKIEKALIVDDDDTFRRTLQSALRRRGVAALTAATVEEGEFILEDGNTDLVILDYRMPRQDGLSALRRYRQKQPDAVLVILTGYGDIPLAVEAVREGADTLLTKPIDPDHLLKVAVDLRSRPRVAGASTTPAPLNLDEMEREAIKAALKQCDGQIAKAASVLGIDRRTLQRKLKKIF